MRLELLSGEPAHSAKPESRRLRQNGLKCGSVRCGVERPARQKSSYKVVKEGAAGLGDSKPVLASLFRKVDGSMSSIEKNAKTVQEHFTRVYDAPSTIDLPALEEIQQRPVREDLAAVPPDEEIIAAIRKANSN